MRSRLLDGRAPELCVLLACAAYMIALALEFPDIVGAMNWNSDSASGFTMASTLSEPGDHGRVIMATSGQYVSLWFGLLTAGLPLHRELWQLAPYAAYLATCALVVFAVWRVASARPAWLAAAILVPASPLLLWFVVRAVVHTPAYLGTAIAGVVVVWGFRSEPRHVALAAIAAIALGVCAASDPLMAVTGLAPLALATALARSRRVALWNGAILAGAVVAAALTLVAGRSITTMTPSPGIAGPGDWIEHTGQLAEGLVRLAHGAGIGHEVSLWRVLLATALVIAAVIAAVTVVARLRDADPARRAHIVYWGSSALLAGGAFVVGTLADIGTYQYFLTVVFSLAALAPLIRSRELLGAGMIAAAVLAITNTVGVARGDVQTVVESGISRNGNALVQAAKQLGVSRGYAGYWNASSLTWNSREALTVRPVQSCANPQGADLCPFGLMSIGAWYEPSAEQRTFLIVDPSTAHVAAVPRGLGDPVATHQVDGMTLLVYPYDIATRLGAG